MSTMYSLWLILCKCCVLPLWDFLGTDVKYEICVDHDTCYFSQEITGLYKPWILVWRKWRSQIGHLSGVQTNAEVWSQQTWQQPHISTPYNWSQPCSIREHCRFVETWEGRNLVFDTIHGIISCMEYMYILLHENKFIYWIYVERGG